MNLHRSGVAGRPTRLRLAHRCPLMLLPATYRRRRLLLPPSVAAAAATPIPRSTRCRGLTSQTGTRGCRTRRGAAGSAQSGWAGGSCPGRSPTACSRDAACIRQRRAGQGSCEMPALRARQLHTAAATAGSRGTFSSFCRHMSPLTHTSACSKGRTAPLQPGSRSQGAARLGGAPPVPARRRRPPPSGPPAKRHPSASGWSPTYGSSTAARKDSRRLLLLTARCPLPV